MGILGLGKKKKKDAAAPAVRSRRPADAAAEAPEKKKEPVHKIAESRRLVFRVKGPWISEKSTRLVEKNQYVFLTEPGASKPEIRKEIEERYGVTVRAIQTVRYAGKRKYLGGRAGSRPGFKKAVVTLKSGQSIDVI